MKEKLGPIIAFSPLKIISKIIGGKNNNSKLIVANEKIYRSLNHKNLKINQFMTNSNNNNKDKTIYKNKRNLVINEYNYKAVPKINMEQNYVNRFFK